MAGRRFPPELRENAIARLWLTASLVDGVWVPRFCSALAGLEQDVGKAAAPSRKTITTWWRRRDKSRDAHYIAIQEGTLKGVAVGSMVAQARSMLEVVEERVMEIMDDPDRWEEMTPVQASVVLLNVARARSMITGLLAPRGEDEATDAESRVSRFEAAAARTSLGGDDE